MAGVREILQNPNGLTDPNNYHEFCRLLARLKSNYQLGELVMVDQYDLTIQLMAKFTVESLQVTHSKQKKNNPSKNIIKLLKQKSLILNFRCGNLLLIVYITC